MKKILGLDIGTNSIGASLLNLPEKFEDYGKEGNIEWLGSRIIPETLYSKAFEVGQKSSPKNMTPAGTRRQARGARRLKHRYKLRRTRLIKVLKALGWLDESFPIDELRKFKTDINENGYSLKISDYMPFSEETILEFKKEMGVEQRKRFDKKKNKEVDFLLPEDWIVYYLRKKALNERISIPELVRIAYMLNQRRGFKSSRKDLKATNILPYQEFKGRSESKDFGDEGIETQFVSITKIESVAFKEEKKDKRGNVTNIYTIKAEDERMQTWEESRKKQPEWEGKEFTFLVTQKIDKNGNLSQLKPQMPKEDDWALCTTALSERIEENHQHPGEYFYEQIREAYKSKRNFKARQYPVYRWRYQKELEAIWDKQLELNPELQKVNSDQNILTKLAEILYPSQAKNNMPKLAEFKSHDLLHIISHDIIYYQRELKSQKNSISECRYEKRKGIDGEYYGLKCIPRSSPLFQEFRIWQDIHNIRVFEREVYENEKTKIDVDVTSNLVDDDVKNKLFDLFNSKSSVTEKDVLILLIENRPDASIRLDIDKKEKIHSHRINLYAKRNELKGNETLSRYRSVFKKAGFEGDAILTDPTALLKLWHIDYSITSSDEEKSKKGITTALNKLLPDSPNKDKAIDLFTKLSELKREYGSYSACAIKKLLPVMRCGNNWSAIAKLIEEKEKEIQNPEIKRHDKIELENNLGTLKNILKRELQIKERLVSINYDPRQLNEIADDDVQKQVLKSFIGKPDLTKGLNTYQACYLIYDKHSEKDNILISSAAELGKYIQKAIPNNSLRNPVVEQVVRETMLLVKDIWNKYGDIHEIHIELGRNLKNNAAEREKIAKAQTSNFDEKLRIKKLLYELKNDGFSQYTESNEIETVTFEVNPNPESPVDIDKFRIWRSLSKRSEFDWAKKVKDEKIPSEQEIKKYTLWISQSCRSPYTGKIIPLSKLFDITQYEIEHVIPRKKMKNDSFNNLVIAEWGVNKAKDNELAANFIDASKGKCKYGNIVYELLTYDRYESHCKDTFKFQKAKLKNLLATEVPEGFIERQLNDTRYIGRKLAELLAPVAKQENGIIFTGGSITSELKKNWGLNKVWKEILRPRFERLEKITGKQYIIHEKDEQGNPVYHFNVKENEELDLKRIDHRHHALDALIIAATTREHIRYLNTLNAADTDEEIRSYRRTLVKGKIRDFNQPWENFTKDAKDKLEETVVTYKTNGKIISKPKNRTAYLKVEDGKIIKAYKGQNPSKKWMAVRKSMFKEPQGIVYLKETYKEKNILKAIEIQIDRMLVQDTPAMKTQSYVYNKEARKIIKDLVERTGISIREKNALINEIKNYLKKNPLKDYSGTQYTSIEIATFEEYAAKRVKLDKSFDHKKIDNIPYGDRPQSSESMKQSIPQLLHQHLIDNNNEPESAFSNEGLEQLAKKAGKPITKVTIAEKKNENSKFGKRYVEVDAGAMAYFVMYEHLQTKERNGFECIPTHKAIEKVVKGQPILQDKNGYRKIILSPGDLLYVPTNEEIKKIKEGESIENVIDWDNSSHLSKRIYKVVSFSKKDLLCIKANIATPIIPYDRKNKTKGEIDWNDKSSVTMEADLMIKEVCIKLKVNRLGNIQPHNQIQSHSNPPKPGEIHSEGQPDQEAKH